MTDYNNDRETTWLREQPDKLLAHYQPIIEATVGRFIARGFFMPEEKEELVQIINLEVWEKRLPRMKEQYSGEVFLRTYFTRIVHNICIDQTRQRKRQPQIMDVDTLIAAEAPGRSAWQDMAIQDELRRWEAALRLLPGNRIKNELCLQLFARTPPSESLIQLLENHATQPAAANMRQALAESYDALPDKEVFAHAVVFFNAVENKSTDGDSLRRWTQMLADQCIELLNGRPPVSNHTRESLKILIRLYYERKSNNDSHA